LTYQVRFTQEARDDLKRLYAFLLDQDKHAAERALVTIRQAMVLLATFPFTCRKAQLNKPFLRELIISFGVNGYVALFEIEENHQVTILAVRHQRENDYR